MELWDVSLEDLPARWDEIDEGGKNRAGVRALCLEDRFYLLVRVCRRIDAVHPWIYARCREVEREPDDCLDLWARYHYKSTIITYAGCIQEILKDSTITIAILSHTKPDATKFMRQIKGELETNETLKWAFPDILYQNPQKESPLWSDEKGLMVRTMSNAKEATVEAHGLVEGMPTGSHFRLRVYEDVVTDKAVTTPEQIEKATRAWELSDNLGMTGGRRWHVGTRYSYADTYEEILKRGVLKPRVYPATHDGRKDGIPVLLSRKEWEDKKIAQGDYTLACQMLQNPLAGTQAMFDVQDLQVYEVKPQTLNVYIMVDPARSKKKDSDNTAMCVIGMDYAANKYLLDGFNHKMDLQERWQNLKLLYYKWIREPGVQSVHAGYEKFGAQADLDYFMEKMRVDKSSFPIEELEWPREGDGSKIDRVQRLGPDIRSHKVFLPYPTVEKLTANQKRVSDSGHPYRVSQRIRRKDHEGNIYDLTEQFKTQIHFFPFGGLKDLVDAASRIYDLEPTPPIMIDESSLEPEVV